MSYGVNQSHTMKDKLKRVVEQRDTRSGRIFDLFVQSLIVLSAITFSIETLPDLNKSQQFYLSIAEYFIVGLFTLEYLLRIYVAKPRLGYVFSFWGMIDLISILPTLLVVGFDLRTLRTLRLIRLFRIAKFGRYSKALQRYQTALSSIKEELVIFIATTLLLLYLSAVGIYYFERDAQPEHFGSIFSSLWWSVTTLTTVGYGDNYPVTVGGKVFSFIVLMIGLGIIAVPAGLLSSALSKAIQDEDKK